MPKMMHDEIQVLLNRIIHAITELDGYFEEVPVEPEVGPPATEDELASLEQYWGHSLPPSYRRALSVYNGISQIWADVPLLSTQEIVEDSNDSTTFEEPFPNLWRFVFACSTDSYDALCFDVSKAGADGEMPVVELSDEGEGQRWESFDVFLTSLFGKLMEEISQEKADRDKLK